MATLVYGLSQSLDGYVDHDHPQMAPDAALFRHFCERERGMAGVIYGRRTFELMRYWEEDRPEWGEAERDFAAAWRGHPKWVASRTLTSVGPDYSLIEGDLETAVRRLKAEHEGEIAVAGPNLARSLTRLGLIDEYWLYVRPMVLGGGTPFFAGPRPPLRLVAHDRVGDDAIRLTYVPA